MEYNEVLTLMYKNYEVLSFGVNYEERRVEIIERLEHFDKAPLGVLRNKDSDSIHFSLLRFINHRSIPSSRTDYEEIIKATGMSSGFKLSFQAHGLCLSDHYWFKRKDEKQLSSHNTYFFVFSMIETIVLIAVSFWQYYYLKHLFEVKGSL